MPMKRSIIASLFICIGLSAAAQNLPAQKPPAPASPGQGLPALDGNWCHADGKRLSVKGTDVITPGGKPLRADYARTFASWVIPDGELNAGMTVTMMLIGSDRAHTREGAADTPPQEWRRCPASAG